MGTVLEVNQSNFRSAVLEQSLQTPVLVDFYAQWCGPCQMLKPMLEQLAQEYDFVLAKIDIDQNPELANACKVEGVPDVRVVSQGQMQSAFVGMVPETQIREFLSQQLHLQSSLDVGLETLQEAIALGQVEEAGQLLQTLLEQYPHNDAFKLQAAEIWLGLGNLEAANAVVSQIQTSDRILKSRAQALQELLQLQEVCEHPVLETEVDQRFVQAARLVLEDGDYEAALELLLDLVGRDRQYRNDGARKTMLSIFAFLGDDHPLTMTYRKKLMLVLY